jgi:solute carrier family 25, member 46
MSMTNKYVLRLHMIVNDRVFVYCLSRRQAQIQSESTRAYLTPISSMRMIYTMKYQQGIGALWKGCFSSLILMTCETISNNLIDELAPFDYPSLRIKHMILKAINSFLLIPLYSVHLLRSVQSDLTVVNQWSPLTIFIEPFQRILGIKTGVYARALPLWYLISFSIPYFVARHAIQNVLHRSFEDIREHHTNRDEPITTVQQTQMETIDDIECQLIDRIPNLVDRSFRQLEANLFAVFVSTFLLYPYETVLNRLFVQGTRTIVDDLDKTVVGCVAINTRYMGFFDCCRTIMETEGNWGRGFFKGIGFLMLKFGLIYASAHCVKLFIERLAVVYTQNTSELSKFHHYVLSKQKQDTVEDRL